MQLASVGEGATFGVVPRQYSTERMRAQGDEP